MGIQSGARFPARSADPLPTSLYGHFTQAINRNRPIGLIQGRDASTHVRRHQAFALAPVWSWMTSCDVASVFGREALVPGSRADRAIRGRDIRAAGGVRGGPWRQVTAEVGAEQSGVGVGDKVAAAAGGVVRAPGFAARARIARFARAISARQAADDCLARDYP